MGKEKRQINYCPFGGVTPVSLTHYSLYGYVFSYIFMAEYTFRVKYKLFSTGGKINDY